MRRIKESARKRCVLLVSLLLVILLVPSFGPQLSSKQLAKQQLNGSGSKLAVSALLLADAVYLDEMGRLSEVMSRFVDALLEKVSFLAEVAIESAMEEQCEISCNPNGAAASISSHLKASSSTTSNAERGGYNSASSQTGSSNSNLLHESQFDEREFTDVSVFVRQFNEKRDSGQLAGSCTLFSLSVDKEDLPLAEMEFCCREFKSCYGKCSSDKRQCDAQFRACFKAMCKQKYDYTNATLIARFRRQLRQSQSMEAPPFGEPAADEPNTNPELELELEVDTKDLKEEETEEEEEEELDLELADKVASNSIDGQENKIGRQERSLPPINQNKSPELKRMIDKYKACKLAAKVLIIGNLAFGCQAYKQAQLASCCNRTTEA